MMFTLTYDDGKPLDVSTRHASTARKEAKRLVALTGRDIHVRMKDRTRFIVRANGTVIRPAGSTSTDRAGDCVRATGKTCFCLTCRAERRDARNA